ncbi:MAG: hypothetical protein CO029_01205 [Candidatus Magasanikbacteria bacterium CG_4_9_14_0_2_um_filter_41_10]|uniref:Uncharacterized protein n=1 Tax=Candidatus Magasanikbacteria bacterium CG_4_10_14_0_2_um_filter_41_31 TaxID=1974639 RepID=A0A2M7V370_9BACT|nr:MAG: hypothetical protein AUJ37_04970 [Candidatus Magasanikbacteria bacterium CG1_02_41_34]PIZ92913.1 MAG: hypothetical protein COX83_03155 [Candidatus Magasanikbacteria bacterium CG_4_10_14_0_2_um_filter_41_31]PJC53730.1 MAG: hypothetical protein CO029_01205 [Candidatus Magasanikbacteria bacterium CG_4_9_14_0_2_um_filter_41_10]
MFSIIPLFLILFSLGVIVVIVARKYPELTILDLDTISERKEKQKKKEIFSRKASQRSKEQHARMKDVFAPVGKVFTSIQISFRKYVKKLKDEVEEKKQQVSLSLPSRQHRSHGDNAISHVFQPIESVSKDETIDDMLKKGMRALEQENAQTAEAAFIRAIETDKKDARAYEGLGDVYHSQEQLLEAEETYLFAHKLSPKSVSILEKLAKLALGKEEWNTAIQYYEQAVIIEDTNATFFATLAELFLKAGQPDAAYEAVSQAVDLLPKNIHYLDMLTEISIMVGDKSRAEDAAQAIRMIDPEHPRLAAFKERIADMGDQKETKN